MPVLATSPLLMTPVISTMAILLSPAACSTTASSNLLSVPSTCRLRGANLAEMTRPKIISATTTIRMMESTFQPEPLLGGLGGSVWPPNAGGGGTDGKGGGTTGGRWYSGPGGSG